MFLKATQHFFGAIHHSAETPLPIRNDELTDKVEIGECEGSERSGRVFHQPPVSHLREAPESFHDSERMLPSRSCPRSALVDRLLVLGQRAMVRASSVHSIAHTLGA